ncbi:MAG TPA: YdcF family protein [Bryobacteraceae bacterium]|nr:YdcF family protein [Bryobacteraceae bacterium]
MQALKWLAVSLVAAYILLTATPLADLYSAPLFVRPDPENSDAIALMSSGAIDAAWVTPDAAQRTWGALKLYREHYAPVIVSAGGDPQARIQENLLIDAGVPREAIVVDTSPTTRTSAMNLSRIMAQRGWRSVVVVTSQMDVPRLRGVFRKLAVHASFFPVPEFYAPKHFHFFRRPAFDISYHATYEYLGLLAYKWKGYI